MTLTHYADRLARYLVKHSKRGLRDPWNWHELKTKFTEDERMHLAEAAYELQQHGLVTISEAFIADDKIFRIRPSFELYWTLDREVFDYDVDDDVAHLVRALLEDETRGSAEKLFKCQSWTLRRFNPAFAQVVAMFPEQRVQKAQANEPYPAAGVSVTTEERAMLKIALARFEESRASTTDMTSSEKTPEELRKVTINLGIISFDLPVSATVLVSALLVVAAVTGIWQWPTLADRFGVGFNHVTPTLVSPPDGAALTDYPRQVELVWQPLTGAAHYLVEVQAQDLGTGEWFPHPGQFRWTTPNTFLSLQFIGDQPGRWQVVAISEDNERSRRSEWREFLYDTSASIAEPER